MEVYFWKDLNGIMKKNSTSSQKIKTSSAFELLFEVLSRLLARGRPNDETSKNRAITNEQESEPFRAFFYILVTGTRPSHLH